MSALCKPRMILALIGACAIFAGPIATAASASDNSIIAVVIHFNPIINKDEHNILKRELAYQQNRKATPVVNSLRHEVRDLKRFASQLHRQSASSRTGARGRNDIVSGTLAVAKAYTTFANELHAHPNGLTKQQIAANKKLATKGRRNVKAGFKLLEHTG